MKKKFIQAGDKACSFHQYVNAPYLRRKFELCFLPDKAVLRICGLGFYRLFINGREITKGLLAPYISNPDDICYYDVYFVKDILQEGENVIGVQLGNGFMNPFGGTVWDFDQADWIGPPRLAVEFKAECSNESLFFEADEQFVTKDSPVFFDELRMGEFYDANQESEGWNLPGYDDYDWKPAVKADTPRGVMKECTAEPIRVRKVLRPVSITECKDGFLYDFGENTAGITQVKINASKGQKITLWHGEILKDGEFYLDNIIFHEKQFSYYREYNQKTIYIAKGEGEEIYQESFTYYGFRYVLVQGISKEQATKDLLTYLVMNSELKTLGGFSCSDSALNTLYKMVQTSDLSNFYYFPTDCPHREKNGWTGGASMSADHMVLMYDVEKSWQEWLCNIRKSQNEKGAIPGIVPTAGWGFAWGNGPAWDSVLFNLPYMLYRYRGNRQVIEENKEAMMRYLVYLLERRNPDHTISIGLGDWVPVGKNSSDYDAPLVVTDSIMAMDMAKKAQEMFLAIENTELAVFAGWVYSEFREAIRNVLLDRETMTIQGNCQTCQAMGLYYQVFEQEEEAQAMQVLLDLIERKNRTFDSGFLGLHCIFHVLSDYGYSNIAYEMITRKEYPSYTHLIDIGETAIPEHFLPDEDLGDSHNHHFLGDIARWMIRCVAGLQIDNSCRVTIHPNFVSELSFAEAWYELPLGRVAVKWEKTSEGYLLYVEYPKKVICKVEVEENGNISVIRNVLQ